MKYIVTKQFKDKYTLEDYKVGRVLDITEDRAAEILSVGPWIEKEKPQPAKKKGKK